MIEFTEEQDINKISLKEEKVSESQNNQSQVNPFINTCLFCASKDVFHCRLEGCKFSDICANCLYESKDRLVHHKEHFELIINPYKSQAVFKYDNNPSLKVLNQLFHDELKRNLTNFKINKNKLEHVILSRNNIIQGIRDELQFVYNEIVKNLEDNLARLDEKYEKANQAKLNNSQVEVTIPDFTQGNDAIGASSKEKGEIKIYNDPEKELKDCKIQFENLLNYLNNPDLIKADFNRVIEKANRKIKRMSLDELCDPNLEFSLKKTIYSNLFETNSSYVTNDDKLGNTNSYFAVKSKEILEGNFVARIRVEKITHFSDFQVAVGVIKANSSRSDYYMDSIVLFSSGKKNRDYQGNADIKITDTWKNNDMIYIKRTNDNSLFFGLNDEDKLAVSSSFHGAAKIVVGFLTSLNGDSLIFDSLESEL